MTFLEQLDKFKLPIEYNAFVEGVKETWHPLWDEAFVYDIRETHGFISIEWSFGDHRPSLEIHPDLKSWFHTCNLKELTEDCEYFEFDAGFWTHIDFVGDKLFMIKQKALAGGADVF